MTRGTHIRAVSGKVAVLVSNFLWQRRLLYRWEHTCVLKLVVQAGKATDNLLVHGRHHLHINCCTSRAGQKNNFQCNSVPM